MKLFPRLLMDRKTESVKLFLPSTQLLPKDIKGDATTETEGSEEWMFTQKCKQVHK
jgi:hypothetical protein